MKPVALVLGGANYAHPFSSTHYCVCDTVPLLENIQTYDLVVFTGGSDVWPGMYGQEDHIHPYTSFDKERDLFEQAVYNECIRHNVPMVGICRGAQFLNVMNHGELYQHIEGHAIAGTHLIKTCNEDNENIEVTSTHHQCMSPTPDGEWLAWSEEHGLVPEVVLYADTQCLCVQYHPEYMPVNSRGYTYFQELLSSFLLKGN